MIPRPLRAEGDGDTGLEPSQTSESCLEDVEALSFPLSARTVHMTPPPSQRVAATSAETKKAGRGSSGGVVPVSAGTKSKGGDKGGDGVLGFGGGEGGGEGYYAQKFSKFYTAFIATTSATQVMPRWVLCRF